MTRIGYTYEAGFHCIRHTRARFPGLVAAHDNNRYPTYFDGENNEVRAVLDTDEEPDGYWSCEECVQETAASRDDSTHGRLVAALEAMVYAFPCRVAINTIFDGQAASAIGQAWNALGEIKPRFFDSEEYEARNEKLQLRADYVIDALEEKRERDRAGASQCDPRTEQDEAFAALAGANARPFTNLTPEEHAQFLNDEVLWPFMDSSLFDDYEREYNERTGTTEFRERFFAACSALLPLKKIHPLPWCVVISHYGPEIYSGDTHRPELLMAQVACVNTVFVAPEDKGRAEADAAFITHACNRHEQLITTIREELDAVRAWYGALRNRKDDISVGMEISIDKLERALAAATQEKVTVERPR